MVMKDATPLTPSSAQAELYFQMLTTYNSIILLDQKKYKYTMM